MKDAWRAAWARLVIDGAGIVGEAQVSTAGEATIRQAFHTSGIYKISLKLYINGAWADSGAGTKALKVLSASKLATPSFTRPSGGTLYITPGNGCGRRLEGRKKGRAV